MIHKMVDPVDALVRHLGKPIEIVVGGHRLEALLVHITLDDGEVDIKVLLGAQPVIPPV